MTGELDLFGEPVTRGMTRPTDPETSVEAARSVGPKLDALQQAVLAAFRTHGPMTDDDLRRVIPGYAWSTVSKRRTELCQMTPPLIVSDRPVEVWRPGARKPVKMIGTLTLLGFWAASIFRTTGTMFMNTASVPLSLATPFSTSYGWSTM